MKIKLVVGIAVVLLIAAQLLFGGRGKTPKKTAAANAAAASARTNAPARPKPDAVDAVAVGADNPIRIVRGDDGWIAESPRGMPADAKKVDALLHSLLETGLEPVPAGSDPLLTGLANGDGLRIALQVRDADEFAIFIGLRPFGEYGKTYARLPDGSVVLIAGDVRGDLGIWRNQPDALPDPMALMDPVAMRFNPGDVSEIIASYPDHRIHFVRGDDNAWRAEGYVPGGRWDDDALSSWIRDLSEFRVAEPVDPDDAPDDVTPPSHTLEIRLPDGVRRVRVFPNHADSEGMLAESDAYPGRIFRLPEWRFRKYFQRLSTLFPAATPLFDAADIRYMDIRRGGETIKITRRDNDWQAVATRYPLLRGRVDRLARLLGGWQPEDYAAPDFKAVRPNYGGPMVEVILANGDVHQYRLAGRHSLFPWRYVTVDGKANYSISDSESGAMFPDFADILDLGSVFGDVHMDDVVRLELDGGDRETPLLVLRRSDDDVWTAECRGHAVRLDGGKGWRLINELLNWPVTGFFDTHSPQMDQPPQYYVHIAVDDGTTRSIAFMPPNEWDVPYLEEGGRAFLTDRNEFFTWLTEVREVMEFIEKDAAAEEEARREADSVPAEPEEQTKTDAEAAGQDDAPFEPEPQTDTAGQTAEEPETEPTRQPPETTEDAEETLRDIEDERITAEDAAGSSPHSGDAPAVEPPVEPDADDASGDDDAPDGDVGSNDAE